MLRFLRQERPNAGSVLFRGSAPLRAEDFSFLERHGVRITPLQPSEDMRWRVALTHPAWGNGELAMFRSASPPDAAMVDYVQQLTDEERADIRAAGSAVSIRTEASRRHVLRDRKNLLRYMSAVMGSDGLAAIDHASTLFWTRSMLEDELAHDADLDISGVYCLHAVGTDGGSDDGACDWLHSHGLGELGAFDFDIIRPSSDVLSSPDLFRSLAFLIVEGRIHERTPGFLVAYPGGEASCVPADEFMQRAHPDDRRARTMTDEFHTKHRAVFCEPMKGLLGRLSRTVRPCRLLQNSVEGRVLPFTDAATEIMAERARNTLTVLQSLMSEFGSLDLPVLTKLGYETDTGGCEYLWFSVHSIRDGVIDATLVNDPHDISSMHEGQRGEHGIERLAEWTILSPVGSITPHSMAAARLLRQHRPMIEMMIRQQSSPEPA